MTHRLWRNAVCSACWLMLALTSTGARALDLKRLDRICIPAESQSAERSMAAVLQEKLQGLYGVEPEASSELPDAGQSTLFLGRQMATAHGGITDGELTAVKYDGYVIKVGDSRVAIAGYAPQGTIYGTYAFLRHVGLKLYPWRNFGAVEVREPLADGKLEPFTLSSKPYFERRDLLGWLDGGRWGADLREYSLGEFRFAHGHKYFRDKGWLGGDHTAPYLVPMGKYYESHPEFFALKGGRRIAGDTENVRVAICMSNPEVHQISVDRALEWMEIQKERRFFHVSDGDTSECRCPHCVGMDPVPDVCTDRYLNWVNSVARAVEERFPDNVCLPLAYGNTTQPPVEVKPAPNAVVMYCPWYWNSRTTSATTWAHPQNVTAMKEFTAWAMRFPDQVGLYDYPGSWVQGQADRLKFLAKWNARVFYSCGGSGDLFQWVNARLLWDPFLNTEDLIDEFADAYYGPAAEPMRLYFRLRREAIEKRMVHTRDAFGSAAFIGETRTLMAQAEEASRNADEGAEARILAHVLDGLQLVLQKTHPKTGVSELRSAVPTYRTDLDRFIRLSRRLLRAYERLGNNYVVRQYTSQFRKTMTQLGLASPSVEQPDAKEQKDEAIFDRTIASLDDQLAKLGAADNQVEMDSPRAVSIRFDADDEAGKWLSDGSQADLIAPPERATIVAPTGEAQTGVRVTAPLSKLPVIPHHKQQMHAGRFYAERVFEPPLDATACFYLDIHLHASGDVPITVYVNNVHSDVDLHAGEQIVRVDFRNYQHDRFNWDDWDKQIQRLSFDVWPQDDYRPYPEAKDVELTFFGLTLTNQKPTPDALPHKAKAIWLSQFRPNIPRGVAVPRELYDQYLQRQQYKHIGLDYGSRWVSERFRTFTEHRSICPVFAIVTDKDASRPLREAAETMQRCFERMFGARLPVNPEGASVPNAILLGKETCVAAGLVTEPELKHVGAEGFVINAYNGRIAIAGPDEAGTAHGVVRYLEDYGVQFPAANRVVVPTVQPKLLHELYLLDWPYFKERPIRGGWWLKAQLSAEVINDEGTAGTAMALAKDIKDIARQGGDTVSARLVEQANRDALSRFVAARLLWDPFADARRLVREFEAVM